MQTSEVATGWDDPRFKGAILSKGQRRPGAPKSVEPTSMKEPLKCTNCGLPVAVRMIEHCVCSMWEVGKVAA